MKNHPKAAVWAILLAWSYVVLSSLSRTSPYTWSPAYFVALAFALIPPIAALAKALSWLRTRMSRKAAVVASAAVLAFCVMSTPISSVYADSSNCYYTYAIIMLCWTSPVPWGFLAGFATCFPAAVVVPSPGCSQSYTSVLTRLL